MATRYSADFGRPNRSLDGVSGDSSNVAGDEFAIVGQGRVDLSWNKIVGGTGSWTALSVSLQLSVDGTNWKSIDTDTATATDAIRSVVAEAPMFVRTIKNSSTTASGTPTVTTDIIVRKSS